VDSGQERQAGSAWHPPERRSPKHPGECGATLASTARTRLSLRPGERGTKKLLAEYGDPLVCVRYRYDERNARRFKTVELVVEEAPWWPEVRGPASGRSQTH